MLILVFAVIIYPVYGGVVEDSWTTMAPLPTPYSTSLGAVAVNGQIYFFAGDVCERYDSGTNTWTTVTPPPRHNSWAAVVACQNKIYIIGGDGAVPTQVYDPSINTWTNRTSMPKSIYSHEAAVVGNKIYVISGGIPSPIGVVNPSETTYVYDPATDSWSTMASIPTPVLGYASAVVDDKIYIIGGGTRTVFVENATGLVQIFDPKMNQWTLGKTLPAGVFGAGACSTSGLFAPERIYVIGGSFHYSGGGTSADLNPKRSTLNQVYDLETGKWSLASSIPQNGSGLSVVNVNDVLYAVGHSTEQYIPIGYKKTSLPTASISASPITASPSSDALLSNQFPTIPCVVATIAIIMVFIGLVVYKKVKDRN